MQASLLPPLRQELELIEGAAGVGGSPSWMIHDPVRNQYYEVDWVSHALLRRWGALPAPALLAQVKADNQVLVSEADLQHLLEFLHQHQLLQPGAADAPRLALRRQALAGTWQSWLLHNYLFFRLPLVRPDGFLRHTQALTGWIYTRSFAWLTLLAGLLGLVGVGRQWDQFGQFDQFDQWDQ